MTLPTIQTQGAADTFTRPNVTGWGMSDDGVSTWAVRNAQTLTMLPTSSAEGDAKGVLAGTNSGYAYMHTTGSPSTSSADVVLALKQRTTSTSSSVGVYWRLQDINNVYMTYIYNGTLYIRKNVAGTPTNIASVALSGWAVGNYWNLYVTMTGTTINVYAWDRAVSMPTTATLTVSDSSLAAAGEVGILSYATSLGAGYVDNWAATTASGTSMGWDSFHRTVWGVASGGQTWQQQYGTAVTSISGHWGLSDNTASVNQNHYILGQNTPTNVDITCKFAVSTGGPSSNDGVGILSTWYSLNVCYFIYFYQNSIYIYDQLHGVLASAAFTISPGSGYPFWMNMHVSAGTIYGYIWLDGDSKPANPQVTATPVIPTFGFGNFGVIHFGSGTGGIAYFNNFTAVSNDPAYIPTDTPYGSTEDLNGNYKNYMFNSAGNNDPTLLGAASPGSWYRQAPRWDFMQPTPITPIDWRAIDNYVAVCVSQHVNYVFVPKFVPTWASATQTWCTGRVVTSTAAVALATAVANRYNDTQFGWVAAIEACDEDFIATTYDGVSYCQSAGDAAALLTVAVYNAVKAVRSDFVVGSAVGLTSSVYPFTCIDAYWAKFASYSYYYNSLLPICDYVQVHLYTIDKLLSPFVLDIYHSNILNIESTMSALAHIGFLLDKNSDVTTHIRVTEFGWIYANNIPVLYSVWTDTIHGEYIAQTLDVCRTLKRVDHCWYHYMLNIFYFWPFPSAVKYMYYVYFNYIAQYPAWTGRL